MNRRILPFAFNAAVLLLSGCVTSTPDLSPVALKATGDTGVSVHVTSTQPGVPEKIVTVPAELTFHGESFDLNCVHGPQPGRLTLAASRGGVSISTGDTTQPGQITQFQVRRNTIAVGAPSNPTTR
jgi:hypothetical protein